MKKQYFLPLALILIAFGVSAQAVGDYRSNANNFNWNNDNSWQRWDGDSWETPTGAQGYPGENAAGIAGTVTIQNGHSVTANTDITANDLGNLTLLGNAQVTFSSNIDIEVTGTITLDGTSQLTGTSTNRTLKAGALVIPATATNARVSQLLFTVSGALTVNGTFTMGSTSFTVNGATNVNTGGSLTLNNDNGTKRFNGRVTVSGTWTSTAITSDDRLIFGGEVITSGTFACGCN